MLPAKRKEPAGGPGAAQPARSAKRAKMVDARTIRSQPSDVAFKNGELDLQSFVDARAFEIQALEASMRRTKAARATRAFQHVPRSMRRRTASHNVKRVPKRLRDKARYQKQEDNSPTVEARKRRPKTTRAKMRMETAKKLEKLAARKRRRESEDEEKEAGEKGAGAASGAQDGGGVQATTVRTRPAWPKIRRNQLNEPPRPSARFKKRQRNKTWLPTHLWHAKRARMTEPSEPLWRFAVPITASEKCYRPTHRASSHKGVVAWDTSYMSTIRLYGLAQGIERTLKSLGLTQDGLWGAQGAKWRAGSRHWTGTLSKARQAGWRQIGPARIIWNPEEVLDDATAASESANKAERHVFIRVHPSCFLELFHELLKLVKMHTPRVHMEDLRFEIGSIELIGPASTEALLAVLHPYHAQAGTEEVAATTFRLLNGITNPSTLPRGALLGFSVVDPRLRYPPRAVDPADTTGRSDLTETLAEWPVDKKVKPYALFSRDARFETSKLPSQKSLHRRKSDLPGKDLEAGWKDAPIPILLAASRLGTSVQDQGRWTLLAPWACIVPICKSQAIRAYAQVSSRSGLAITDRFLAEMGAEKQRLAASIVKAEAGPFPVPAPNRTDMNGHPLCPDEEDLLGFVTSGAYSLSEGQGTAIASLVAEKAVQTWRADGPKEGKLCIVRNAGENIGWLARWEGA
ncbi:hypothetical protein P8C59_001082 [Phyllachora maydis]|uniref:Uncharacterized protein n=1 Tax=Phyllachora maydis TaxID=1825666 RepID=A0AAD9HXP2_9PEZI|nr:hypothetical protein P8C59_001082 [Phyllachora maydis]